MIKTLQNTLKQDKEQFTVPRSVQDTIPIRRIWPDGVFQFGSKFSKTLRFRDINYAIASKEDKTAMFLSYSELLNALDTGSTTKITINNKRLNRRNFEQEILIPPTGMIWTAAGRSTTPCCWIRSPTPPTAWCRSAISPCPPTRKMWRKPAPFLTARSMTCTSRLNHMDSRCEELDAVERLRILHDFYRVGEETRVPL